MASVARKLCRRPSKVQKWGATIQCGITTAPIDEVISANAAIVHAILDRECLIVATPALDWLIIDSLETRDYRPIENGVATNPSGRGVSQDVNSKEIRLPATSKKVKYVILVKINRTHWQAQESSIDKRRNDSIFK